MSGAKRIWKIFKGLLTVLCAVLIAMQPADGYLIVVFILDITLLIYGLRLLIYYLVMARFMVGGITTLYKSIIVIDLGLFILGLHSTPQKYVMLYLIGCLAFNGVVDIIDAVGAKKLRAGSWKYQFSYGLGKVLIAVVCLFYLDSTTLVTYMYCAGLIHSALSDIISACRKTAIVYIE